LHLLVCRTPQRRSAEGVEAATGAAEEGFMAVAGEEGSTGAEEVGFMAVAAGTSLAGVEDALMAAGAFTAARREWRREWAEARPAGWADMGAVRRTISGTGMAGRRPPEIG
jgi:hypothetical protein